MLPNIKHTAKCFSILFSLCLPHTDANANEEYTIVNLTANSLTIFSNGDYFAHLSPRESRSVDTEDFPLFFNYPSELEVLDITEPGCYKIEGNPKQMDVYSVEFQCPNYASKPSSLKKPQVDPRETQ